MPRTAEACLTDFCPLLNFLSRLSRARNTAAPRLLHYFLGRLTIAGICLAVMFGAQQVLPGVAFAQNATATLSGSVVDQHGAVIPNVSIAVINLAQGFQRTTTSNEEGVFVVPLLPPGTYTIKVEHPGFTTSERRDVVLNVNDQVFVRIPLRVGNLTSQTVDIVERTALIDESPAVATIVDRQFVANLPLNGRSFQSLIALTPGVVLTKADFNESGQFSVNGQRANANYFTVDGVSANIGSPTSLLPGQNGGGSLPGLTTFGGTNNLVSVDALQEFRVMTSTYAAEYGRTPGAQVSMVTRSGTNDLHGSAFEYFRNEALDANDWFANSRGLAKPPLRQNHFGGVLGGPIMLPRFGEGGRQPGLDGRNRTFFFFSLELLRLRQPLVRITDVPGRSARANPQAPRPIIELLNAFPLPTGPDKASGFAEFAASYANPTTLNATSIRIDHSIGSRFTIFGRYNQAPSETSTRTGDGLRSVNTVQFLKYRTDSLTLGSTFMLGASISNDLRFNYSQNTNESFLTFDSFGGAIVPADSLLFPSFASRSTDAVNVTFSGGTNASLWAGNTAANKQRQLNIVDSLSIVTGDHLLKFGVDYRRLSPILAPRNYAQFVTFNGITNAVNGALSGIAQSILINRLVGPQVPILTNLSLYGQDMWKVSPRLSLTYGLRWEVNTPPREANGNEAYAIMALGPPESLRFAPRGTPLWKTTYNNFAPRIGLAYQLSTNPGKEIVLRGGFGVFYDIGVGTIANAYVSSWPFRAMRTVSNVPFPVSLANAQPPEINSNPPAISGINIIDPNLKLPYTYQWNGALEQSLGSDQTISLTYVGAAGRRLLRQSSLRFGLGEVFVNPEFKGDTTLTTNAATSDYHALQVQLQRRLSRGLQATASYTWAKSIDIASNDSVFNAPAGVVDVNGDRAPSDFDIRHTLTTFVTYDLPSPKIGTAGKAVLSDWGVDAIFNARSAAPVNVILQSLTPELGLYFFRPDLIGGVPVYLSDASVGRGRRINPAAFAVPASGRHGTLGRNSLRGFPFWQLDLAVRREFRLTEKLKMQLKAESFNIFNHPNFGDPNGTWALTLPAFGLFIPNPTFGTSTAMLGRQLGTGGNAGGFNPLYNIGGPRSIQLSLRLAF